VVEIDRVSTPMAGALAKQIAPMIGALVQQTAVLGTPAQ